MKTLNARIKFLVESIFTAMDFADSVYVRNGKYSTNYMQCGKGGSKYKYVRMTCGRDYSTAENVASVVCAVAKAHGLSARWTNKFNGEIVIQFEVSFGYKNSEALVGIPTDYSALAGFEGKTHGDLQLFGGQGFNREDSARVLALLA